MFSRRDVVIGCCVGLVVGWFLACFFGDWRPAGEGRIVNARTGVLRVTTTGEYVDDYLARVKLEHEKEQANQERERVEREKNASKDKSAESVGGWPSNFLPDELK